MPVRNCLAYSKLAVASLPLDNFYMIDNASSDGTAEWAQWLAKANPGFKYMPQETNMGVAAAWNLGIRTAFSAGATLALVVNNDIVFAPDTLRAMIRWMDFYWDKALITAHVVAGSPEHLKDMRRYPEVEAGEHEFSAFMISRRDAAAVGLFDESFFAYYEDLDYVMRLKEAGIFYGRAMDALICHFHSRTMHEGMTPGLDKVFLASREKYIAKWRHKLEVLP
jgi:GT2 family glycosyltransferase